MGPLGPQANLFAKNLSVSFVETFDYPKGRLWLLPKDKLTIWRGNVESLLGNRALGYRALCWVRDENLYILLENLEAHFFQLQNRTLFSFQLIFCVWHATGARRSRDNLLGSRTILSRWPDDCGGHSHGTDWAGGQKRRIICIGLLFWPVYTGKCTGWDDDDVYNAMRLLGRL